MKTKNTTLSEQLSNIVESGVKHHKPNQPSNIKHHNPRKGQNRYHKHTNNMTAHFPGFV